MVEEGFGPGTNGPFIVARRSQQDATTTPTTAALADAHGEARRRPTASSRSPRRVINGSGNAAMHHRHPRGLAAVPEDRATSSNDLRDNVLPAAVAGTGVTALLGGADAVLHRPERRTSRTTSLIFITGVVLLSLLILLLAFRSPIIAIKAGIMNLLSVGAAYRRDHAGGRRAERSAGCSASTRRCRSRRSCR